MDNTVDCTETCDCLNIQMEIIHGSDGKTFTSPCHAGCKDIKVGADKGEYVSDTNRNLFIRFCNMLCCSLYFN